MSITPRAVWSERGVAGAALNVSQATVRLVSPSDHPSYSLLSCVVSGDIRVIEYQVLAWAELDCLGDVQQDVMEAMGVTPDTGILRCVTIEGRKVTFVGNANSTNALVESGAASDPQGIAIAKKDFPVMLQDWPFRIRED